MDELISRKSLVDAFKAMNDTGKDCLPTSIIVETIDEAPTVDAVPVVRCKDCKRFVTMEGCVKIFFCDEYGGEVTENDYCSRAKRRESDAGN